MNIFLIFLTVLLGLGYLMFSTWADYLALMNIRKNKAAFNMATPTAKVFGYILLTRGLIKDFLVNVFIGTIAFMEFPREWLFTIRCERHMAGTNELYKHRAKWFCYNWLDPYDQGGKHCRG